MKTRIHKLPIREGDKYGMLTVVKEGEKIYLPSNQFNRTMICRCECGAEKQIRIMHLTRGKIISCGCIQKTKNGESNTVLHKRWKAMFERTAITGINKERYFDRGISVCKEWEDYFTFKEWALKNGFQESLTIDRIDNSKGYSPDNCRYVTPEENCNNRDETFFVFYKGEKVAFMQLMRNLKIQEINYTAIRQRIKRGWDDTLAIDTPIKKGGYVNRYNKATY